MVALSSLLSLAGALASTAYAQDSTSTIEGCSQFKVNGTWQEYFTFYRFYDFRYENPSSTEIKPSPWPKKRDNESELQQFKRFNDATWTDEWSIYTVNKEPANKKLIPMSYVAENVFMG